MNEASKFKLGRRSQEDDSWLLHISSNTFLVIILIYETHLKCFLIVFIDLSYKFLNTLPSSPRNNTVLFVVPQWAQSCMHGAGRDPQQIAGYLLDHKRERAGGNSHQVHQQILRDQLWKFLQGYSPISVQGRLRPCPGNFERGGLEIWASFKRWTGKTPAGRQKSTSGRLHPPKRKEGEEGTIP